MNKNDIRYNRVVDRVLFGLKNGARRIDVICDKVFGRAFIPSFDKFQVDVGNHYNVVTLDAVWHALGLRKENVPSELKVHVLKKFNAAYEFQQKQLAREKDRKDNYKKDGVRHQKNPKGKARKYNVSQA